LIVDRRFGMCGHSQPSRNIDLARFDITNPDGTSVAY